jgi:hypothetical protein
LKQALGGELAGVLHADPRKMEREELLACCKLWHLEDGSFLQATSSPKQ